MEVRRTTWPAEHSLRHGRHPRASAQARGLRGGCHRRRARVLRSDPRGHGHGLGTRADRTGDAAHPGDRFLGVGCFRRQPLPALHRRVTPCRPFPRRPSNRDDRRRRRADLRDLLARVDESGDVHARDELPLPRAALPAQPRHRRSTGDRGRSGGPGRLGARDPADRTYLHVRRGSLVARGLASHLRVLASRPFASCLRSPRGSRAAAGRASSSSSSSRS